MSVSPDTRVCPRCGRPASDAPRCECGADLEAMRAMLPTHEQWQAAAPARPARRQTASAALAAAGAGIRQHRRAAALALLAGVVVLAAIIAEALSPASKPLSPASKPLPRTASAPGAASTATPSPPAVGLADCAAAWNTGSTQHRRDLAGAVGADTPAQAVIGRYAAALVRLTRVGGGSQVVAAPGACVVVAHDSVFIHQANGSWGWVQASPGFPFPQIAVDAAWTARHANALVRLGHGAEAGDLTPRTGAHPVTLDPAALGRR